MTVQANTTDTALEHEATPLAQRLSCLHHLSNPVTKTAMRSKLLAVLASSALLAACSTAPTPEERARADYGPVPNDAQRIVKQYMAQRLKDSESARYEFLSQPKKDWSRWSGNVQYGYGTCVYINAKNSYGGYTGPQMHYFLIRSDTVLVALLPIPASGDANAKAWCKDHV